MTVYIKCVVLFNLHKMLFIIYYHNLVIIVDETWVSVSSRMGIDVLKGYSWHCTFIGLLVLYNMFTQRALSGN